ncbi:hypothetical protein GF376_04275 [Candidatus Peregrinibacteria bacterium]|nr:hypothetical protein [Candidatus Peregrinibacteria bacterium]
MVSDDFLAKRGKTIPNKKPLSVEVKKSIYMLISTLMVIIVMVSIVYLLNSSQSSQQGNTLKQNQILKDDLIDQSRILINKIIEAQSFKTIENSQVIEGMIKPENIEYIDKSEQNQ